MATGSLERHLASESDTQRLGEDLALAIRPGDVLLLEGDLGAGKSTLARSLIRALAEEPALEVPSPTFTLVQSYDTPVPLNHFDLYRLADASELDELGLDEMLAEGAALVEWPERGDGRFPASAVRIALEHDGDGRRATLSGEGPVFDRLARSLQLRDFLENAGFGAARRARFVADASARWYEIVDLPGTPRRVLMNSPRLVLGPPVRDGRPYAEIAHTAQSVAAFVALDRLLADAGMAVPEILAQDLDRGFLLISHIGSESFLVDGQPVAERYAAAAELLADLHGIEAPGVVHAAVPPPLTPPHKGEGKARAGEGLQGGSAVEQSATSPNPPCGEGLGVGVPAPNPDNKPTLIRTSHGRHSWPSAVPVAPGVEHAIPPYDRDALLIEVELLPDWYVRALTGQPPEPELRTAYLKLWNAALDRLAQAQYGLVLRDYHSPNIVWRGERSGHERLGLLDFQDALIGPVAYDVASLAMDARVTVPEDIEALTLDTYVKARERAGGFNAELFRETYAIMAAQRNSKILGIFVRLNLRDGKPHYLRHLPRIRDYLRRALAHPSLAEMRDFYEANGFLEERAL